MEGGGGKWSKEKEKEKEWRDDYDALPIALPHTPVSEATMIRCWEEGACPVQRRIVPESHHVPGLR